jgi:UDP-2,4-diacetamido-2,4,6-trideoxy-beta-L-altropyranose hydrolase
VLSAEAAPGSDEDAAWLVEQAARIEADWVVVDGYVFSERYQGAIGDAGARLLIVDDLGQRPHPRVSLVVNQNAYADEALYAERGAGTRLLLGTDYALLRREFLDCAPRAASSGAANHILVSMGGADPAGATLGVLQALASIEDPALRVTALVGPGNTAGKRLLADNDDPRIEVRHAGRDMPQWMLWADLAISAAGTTTWEFAFLGVPTLLVVLADNQLAVARSMDEAGACIDLGWVHELEPAVLHAAVEKLRGDASARSALSRAARERVDGRGPARVVRAMQACAAEPGPPS